jgi:hypothetical protein
MPSPQEKEAAARLAHLEGILVDPVYWRKGLLWIADVRSGYHPRTPAIFSYADDLSSAKVFCPLRVYGSREVKKPLNSIKMQSS